MSQRMNLSFAHRSKDVDFIINPDTIINAYRNAGAFSCILDALVLDFNRIHLHADDTGILSLEHDLVSDREWMALHLDFGDLNLLIIVSNATYEFLRTGSSIAVTRCPLIEGFPVIESR